MASQVFGCTQTAVVLTDDARNEIATLHRED
jgi:hypothetical protein